LLPVQERAQCPGESTMSRRERNVQERAQCPGESTMSRREHNVQERAQCPQKRQKFEIHFIYMSQYSNVIINCFPFIDKFHLYRAFINITEHEEYF
jgi:hypothetical protein